MQLQLERKGKLEAQEKMLNTQKKLHDSSEMPNGDYTKVIVEWFDAYEMESGWQTIEDAIKIKPPIKRTRTIKGNPLISIKRMGAKALKISHNEAEKSKVLLVLQEILENNQKFLQSDLDEILKK